MKTANTFKLLRNLVTALAVITTTGALAADEPRVFTVDNTGGPHADFIDLQEAMDAAQDGDIFHVLGSPYNYSNITVTRQVHLFGPGYNLARVHEEGYQKFYDARVGSVTFTADEEIVDGALVRCSSAGSTISGLFTSRITVQVSDVTVQRNRAQELWGGFVDLPGGDRLHSHRVRVMQNFFWGTSSRNNGIQLGDSNALGHIVVNNIVLSHRDESIRNAVVRNNIFRSMSASDSNFHNSTVENNILGAVGSGSRQSIFNNNVVLSAKNELSSDFLSENSFSENLWDVDDAFLFEESGAFDEQFKLAEFSLAREAGVDGIDAGAFDGPFPYEISGVPSLPRVKIMAPGPFTVSPNSDLTIPVKIKVE